MTDHHRNFFVVGSASTLQQVIKTRLFQTSHCRVLLHFEPTPQYILRNSLVGIDVLLRTVLSTNYQNVAVDLYVPYLFFSIFQFGLDPEQLEVRRESVHGLAIRKFGAYATSHCRSPHRTDFYNFIADEYKVLDALDVKCGDLDHVVDSTRMRGDEKEWMHNVIGMFGKYKFAFVFESFNIPGYISEKILVARLAGSIPVYYGDDIVNKYVNREAYINCSPHQNETQAIAFNRCLKTIRSLDQSDDAWFSMYSSTFLTEAAHLEMQQIIDTLRTFVQNISYEA